jgi:hypothetical protein
MRRPITRQAVPVHAVLREQQIEYRRDPLPGNDSRRYPARQDTGAVAVEARQLHGGHVAVAAVQREQGVHTVQVQVPVSFARMA